MQQVRCELEICARVWSAERSLHSALVTCCRKLDSFFFFFNGSIKLRASSTPEYVFYYVATSIVSRDSIWSMA